MNSGVITGATYWSYTVTGLSGDIYVAAHAEGCIREKDATIEGESVIPAAGTDEPIVPVPVDTEVVPLAAFDSTSDEQALSERGDASTEMEDDKAEAFGCCGGSPTGKGVESIKRLIGDWMLIGLSMMVVFSLAGKRM